MMSAHRRIAKRSVEITDAIAVGSGHDPPLIHRVSADDDVKPHP